MLCVCYHSVSDVRVRDVSFSLDQTEDKESALDFTLHQSDAEQHFEEDVFRGFSNEDDEKEGKRRLEALN